MDENYNFGGYENGSEPAGQGRVYDYYEVNSAPEQTTPPDPKPPKKSSKKIGAGSGIGRKFGLTITMALVFGLVAGLVFQGVNVLGDNYIKKLDGEENSAQVDSVQMIAGESGRSSKTDAGIVANNSGTDTGYTVADIASNAMPSVVAITAVSVQEIQNFWDVWGGTQEYEGVGSGSGIIIGQNDDELLIATNNHVVENSKNLSVSFYGDEVDAAALEDQSAGYSQSAEDLAKAYAKNSVSAQIKGTDADNDLAVIAVKKKDVPDETMDRIKVAVMGDSGSLVVGEQVVAIGNALGYGQSVTSGYVSALDRVISSDKDSGGLIQTDAAINPGNSGGALLNMKGEVIGINSSKFADEEVEGMGFAIPLATAEPILDDLMNRKTREKVDEKEAGYLGINCLEVSSEVAQRYKIPTGVFVSDVIKGQAAEKAGVKSGDVIVEIDGIKISSYAELTEQLLYYPAGETVDIVVSRANGGEYKEQTLSITLGKRPEE